MELQLKRHCSGKHWTSTLQNITSVVACLAHDF